jgi:phosphoribosyl-ATP pyrophosphohydrolase/phosphoribosyl-AMP cyclohydrolase
VIAIENDKDLAALDWEKGSGLLPAIVQHADDDRVLMLGYVSSESLHRSLQLRQVVFFSRSRGELWRKGETSGNVLELVAVRADCDRDTVLIRARPAGPVCHLGTATCFDDDHGYEPQGRNFLARLESVIASRANAPAEESYTARLLGDGVGRIAKKVGEEGVETALAAVSDHDEALVGEAADLVYHLLVLLNARGLDLASVERELERRHSA